MEFAFYKRGKLRFREVNFAQIIKLASDGAESEIQIQMILEMILLSPYAKLFLASTVKRNAHDLLVLFHQWFANVAA